MPFSMAFLASIAFSLASFREVAGVGAEGNQLFLALKVVFQSPAFCASRRDEQVQPFAVKEFLCFFSRFRGADDGIGQGYGVILLQGFYYLDMYPKNGYVYVPFQIQLDTN